MQFDFSAGGPRPINQRIGSTSPLSHGQQFQYGGVSPAPLSVANISPVVRRQTPNITNSFPQHHLLGTNTVQNPNQYPTFGVNQSQFIGNQQPQFFGSRNIQNPQFGRPINPIVGDIPNGRSRIGMPSRSLAPTGISGRTGGFSQGKPISHFSAGYGVQPGFQQGFPQGIAIPPGGIPINHLGLTGASINSPFLPQPVGFGSFPPHPSYLGFKPVNQPINVDRMNIDTHIENERIYCVICQDDYDVNQKDEHIRKHQRPIGEGMKVRKLAKQYKQEYLGPQTRPIVEPEEYNIQYDPNSFIIQHENVYTSPAYRPTSTGTMGVGTEDFVEARPITVANPGLVPQNTRISGQGQTVTYDNHPQNVNPMSTIYPNEPSLIVNPPQFQGDRFERNTFVSDEPSPLVQPSVLYGRDTIQSQDFRSSNIENSKLYSGHMNPIQEEGRSSVQGSQRFQDHPYNGSPNRETSTQPQIYETDNQRFSNVSNLKPDQSGYASVMSPIKQESQHRQTNSFGQDASRPTFVQSSSYNQPAYTNSVVDPHNSGAFNQQNAAKTSYQPNSPGSRQPSIANYGNLSQSNEHQIPFEDIIQEKGYIQPQAPLNPSSNQSSNPLELARPAESYQANTNSTLNFGNQSVTTPYQQSQNSMANSGSKIKKLPKFSGGWN